MQYNWENLLNPDGSTFLKVPKVDEGFCDERVPSHFVEKYIPVLNSLEPKQFTFDHDRNLKVFTEYSRVETESSLTCACYKSENYAFECITVGDEDRTVELICLYKINNINNINNIDGYCVVGCDGAHPFIETPDFTYANSDGSGPDIGGSTLEERLDNFKKYFVDFTNDEWH